MNPADFDPILQQASQIISESGPVESLSSTRANELKKIVANMLKEMGSLKGREGYQESVKPLRKQLKFLANSIEIVTGVGEKATKIRNIQKNNFLKLVYEVARHKGIKIDEQTAAEAFEQYANLGHSLEDNSAALLTELLSNPGVFRTSWLDLSKSDQKKGGRILTDLLLYSAFQVLKTNTGLATYRTTSGPLDISLLRPLTFPEASQALIQLDFHLKKDDDSRSPFFLKLAKYDYENLTPEKKCLLYTWAKFDTDDPQDEAFFQNLLDSPKLSSLLFASSVKSEQNYLNTCALACINQNLFLRIGSLPALVSLSRKMIQEVLSKYEVLNEEQKNRVIHSNAWGLGGKTVEQAVLSEVAKAQANLDHIETQFKELLLNPESEKDTQQVKLLSELWNNSMQRLSTVFAKTESPAYLSKKMIKGKWGASAALMIVPGVIGSVVANYPSPKKRLVSPVDPSSTNDLLAFIQKHLTLRAQILPKLPRLRELAALPAGAIGKEELDGLWDEVTAQGSTLFSMIDHYTALTTMRLNGEKVFCLADPKGLQYQIYNYEQFRSFIKYHDT